VTLGFGGGGVIAKPFGALEITPEGTRLIAFANYWRIGAAIAAGSCWVRCSVGVTVQQGEGERNERRTPPQSPARGAILIQALGAASMAPHGRDGRRPRICTLAGAVVRSPRAAYRP
jgi:hypothetical protein